MRHEIDIDATGIGRGSSDTLTGGVIETYLKVLYSIDHVPDVADRAGFIIGRTVGYEIPLAASVGDGGVCAGGTGVGGEFTPLPVKDLGGIGAGEDKGGGGGVVNGSNAVVDLTGGGNDIQSTLLRDVIKDEVESGGDAIGVLGGDGGVPGSIGGGIARLTGYEAI